MNTNCDIAIIGGGAAGLCAAISAARQAADTGAPLRVVVLEANDRVGHSILQTGNGRCNFSNADIAAGSGVQKYRNADFVQQVFGVLNTAFPAPISHDPVLDFFEELGLVWREEEDGRRYPLANKASVVLDVLRAEVARLGVEEVCGASVTNVEVPQTEGNSFTLKLADGTLWHASAVVVACGGQALQTLKVASLEPSAVAPMLGPVRVCAADQALTRALDNIRVRCSVSLVKSDDAHTDLLPVQTETGELLFRDYGVSGICIFNLSRFAQAGDTFFINFLPVQSVDAARAMLAKRKEILCAQYAPLTFERYLRGLVVPRVAEALLKRRNISPYEEVESTEVLVDMLTRTSLKVDSIGPISQCQVYRGGFMPAAFDTETLQARETPGLFTAGEALDVDGPCGGYNLHWAWGSGLLAGRSAARHVEAGGHA